MLMHRRRHQGLIPSIFSALFIALILSLNPAIQRAIRMPAGPLSASACVSWMIASTRDANLFDGEESSPDASAGSRKESRALQTAISPAPSLGPTLQGATNGTIGPQSSEQTIISGVNTAGAIRVNSASNLEFALKMICNVVEVFLASGCVISGLFGLYRLSARRPARSLLLMSVIFAVSYLCFPVALLLVLWICGNWILRLISSSIIWVLDPIVASRLKRRRRIRPAYLKEQEIIAPHGALALLARSASHD